MLNVKGGCSHSEPICILHQLVSHAVCDQLARSEINDCLCRSTGLANNTVCTFGGVFRNQCKTYHGMESAWALDFMPISVQSMTVIAFLLCVPCLFALLFYWMAIVCWIPSMWYLAVSQQLSLWFVSDLVRWSKLLSLHGHSELLGLHSQYGPFALCASIGSPEVSACVLSSRAVPQALHCHIAGSNMVDWWLFQGCRGHRNTH